MGHDQPPQILIPAPQYLKSGVSGPPPPPEMPSACLRISQSSSSVIATQSVGRCGSSSGGARLQAFVQASHAGGRGFEPVFPASIWLRNGRQSGGFSFPSDNDEEFRGGRGKRVNRPPATTYDPDARPAGAISQ
jgi:hypothetical protein